MMPRWATLGLNLYAVSSLPQVTLDAPPFAHRIMIIVLNIAVTLSLRSVIGGENHDGILDHTVTLQRIHDLTDRPVQLVDVVTVIPHHLA